MNSSSKLWLGVLLGLLLSGVIMAPANAAEPYELDPTLSLTGDCSVSEFDPVPDPSCPYPDPPAGPVKNNCTKDGPTETCSSRFDSPRAIAIDPYGNEYVASWAESSDANGNIDVFDDEGRFITEIKAPNAQSIAVDSKGNLYVFEDSGKLVRYEAESAGYEPEKGKIAYGKAAITVSTGEQFGAVVVDAANDQPLVVRSGVITRYKSGAEGNGFLESFTPSGIGVWTEAIAIDSQRRRIYVSYCKGEFSECGVKVLGADSPHTLLKNVEGPSESSKFTALFGRLGIAIDEETGDFFVADIPLSARTVYQFNETYELLSQFKSSEFQATTSTQIAVSNGERTQPKTCKYPTDPVPLPGDACNRHILFVPRLESSGRAIAFHPSNQAPPEILGVATAGIGETEAELQATIFPHGVLTEYSFQITTQAAWEGETEKFEDAITIPGGTIAADKQATKVTAFATGLVAGQSYRFRIVAGNKLGKAAEEGQNEATFATYDDAAIAPPATCPNEAFRIGPSAPLPDCRAYELVTPADTNGRSPKGVGFVGNLFTTVEAAPTGDAVWFKIEGGSLPGSSGVGSFEGDPYVASRGSTGWSSNLTGASGDEATSSIPGSTSPDQGYSFWSARIAGSMVINGEESQYLRYPDGHSELIGRGSLGSDPKADGKLITEGATHVIFETLPTVAVKLESNAPPDGTAAVYDRTIDPGTGKEETHTVSLLPGDVTPAGGQSADYEGASKDGEGIAFSIGNKLYLRVGNETTYEAGDGVKFAGVSEGGGRIFYLQGGNLKAFDVADEEVVAFTAIGNVIPVNVSSDGTRAYFVSPSVLGGTNPEGDSAQPGEQNVYLSEEGDISFVATVTEEDVNGSFDGLGLWTEVGSQIARDPSRLNPDGSVLLFQSRAEITGYPESEFPQIYRYDSDEGELQCISCIPTMQPATGGATLQTLTLDSLDPPPLSPNGYVPNLNPQGTRIFFESTEALVSTDTDQVNDVYEWEAQGVGSCKEAEGCVYLISSGQSESDNYLYGHSTDGRDVFFTTGDELTGWDSAGGAISLYDARIGGGFPEPGNKGQCAGDACRPSVTPTPPPPPIQSSTQGRSGNLQPGKPRSCPKGKRKVKKNGKVRCVKKKQKGKGGKANKQAGADRGAGK